MRVLLHLAAAALLVASCASPQRPVPVKLLDYADFPELEHSHNVQGCAVYGDYFFGLMDKGWCNVFDLKAGELAAQFPLGSQGKNNHANVAFFGPYRYDKADKFPLLYVSQCKSKPVDEIGLAEIDSLSRLLFVERILADDAGVPFGAELVQIVTYEPAEWNSRLWIADTEQPDLIYCYGNTTGNEKPDNRIALKTFPFPEFSADRFMVELADSDAIDSTYVDCLLPEGARGPQNGILQGAAVVDGILFLPIGAGVEKHPCEVFCAGLRKHKGKYAHFDFTDVLPCEPEDLDIWDGLLVCPCNTSDKGAVYGFRFKDFGRALKSK